MKKEKPKAELFLRHIFAEKTSEQYRPPWSFPWERDWLKNWPQDWVSQWMSDQGVPSGRCLPSLGELFSRREKQGGLVYNARTRAIYKVNDNGLELLQSLQGGKTRDIIIKELDLTDEEIELFINTLMGSI